MGKGYNTYSFGNNILIAQDRIDVILIFIFLTFQKVQNLLKERISYPFFLSVLFHVNLILVLIHIMVKQAFFAAETGTVPLVPKHLVIINLYFTANVNFLYLFFLFV